MYVAIAAWAMLPIPVQAQIPTTLEDYFQAGTQPDASGEAVEPIVHSYSCSHCHELDVPYEVPIYVRWRGSLMANSARDPLFHACLAVANQDAAFAGEMCLRCHAPGAWLAGRSTPPDGSALIDEDFDGVNCNFCHRMVDPIFRPAYSPREDLPILAALKAADLLPVSPGGGNYIIDPRDTRRGPFRPCLDPPDCNEGDIPRNYHGVPILYSPFHSTSEICATCHDVSNPAFIRRADGTYALDALGAAHPTLDKFDMFPLERTYSEWANSDYATIGVQHDGVFGGSHPTGVMRTCQDCHMPDTPSFGSVFWEEPFFERANTPAHDFVGGNTWMQHILGELYPDDLPPQYLEASIARAEYMLRNAATLEAGQEGCSLRVRITNQTGHKLPTGYPEGRRMWLSVEFRDAELNVLAARGRYDADTADLTVSDTKVYEAVLGMDAAIAAQTGRREGPSFHFALNNKIYKDNRIPPRGFTLAAFTAVQAQPVGTAYADGQFWDDTDFRVPPGASSATVTLHYQTASKEYITFLRDENRTNQAGVELYHWWEMTGRSPPVEMRELIVSDLQGSRPGDADCDGDVDLVDHRAWVPCPTGTGQRLELGCEVFDFDLDGDVDLADAASYLVTFGAP
jgi:hypothetical protein